MKSNWKWMVSFFVGIIGTIIVYSYTIGSTVMEIKKDIERLEEITSESKSKVEKIYDHFIGDD